MSSAPLEDLAVPYPELLAVYQQRLGELTNECLLLRAAVTHLQRPQVSADPAALAAPPGESEG